MGLAIATAPASEPITLTEAKAHCRVDSSADDTLLTALIQSAREWAEGFANQRIVAQAWDYTLDGFPACIDLPFGPVTAITHVKYYDTANVLQTLSSSAYDYNLAEPVVRILPAYGYSWPSTYERQGAVSVRFAAGYATVPERIKAAIKLHVEAHYDRDPVASKTLMAAAEALLWPLRTLSF